jgi:hypothetical protein
LPTFRPTFIKLDVEGAEPEALIGGRQTITSHRPTLAVSAYHQPDHLWSLIHAIDALESAIGSSSGTTDFYTSTSCSTPCRPDGRYCNR